MKKVKIFTLGCKVNQYESEAIAERLESLGYEILREKDEIADAYIINTCTVTSESDRKCRQMIRRAIKLAPKASIFVTGCYAQVSNGEVEKIKGVDYISGNSNKVEKTVNAVIRLDGKKTDAPEVDVPSLEKAEFDAVCASSSERTRAYIKIEDGCDNHCSYCIIPSARGSVRSKLPEDIINEAKKLRAAGYKELVLTGIEVVGYGKDLKAKGIDITLGDIICDIERETGFDRISLGSIEPSFMKKEFIDKISGLKSISHHFHLSLQSGCDKTLAGMKRKYNTATVRKNVDYIRSVMPDATFSADVIVGFPGETEEDFQSTCEFISSLNLLHAHVFAYSRRKGTVADSLSGQIDECVKRERSQRLISICERKKAELLSSLPWGSIQPVLFEAYKCGNITGRLNNFIEVKVKGDASLEGEIRNIRLLSYSKGEVLGELS